MKKILIVSLLSLILVFSLDSNVICALNTKNGPTISITEPDEETIIKVNEGKIKFKNTAIGILLKNNLDLRSYYKSNQIDILTYDEYRNMRNIYTSNYFYGLRSSFLNKYNKLSKKYNLTSDISSPYFFIYTPKKIKSIDDLVNLSPDFKEMINDDMIDSIFEISFYEQTLLRIFPEIVIDPGGGSGPGVGNNEDILEAINVIDLIETYHDGTGIKIGFLEFNGVIDSNNDIFDGRNVTVKSNTIHFDNPPQISEHATNVARIAAGNDGIAQDSEIYSAEYEMDAEGNFRMPDNEIQWFIMNGVNIINASFGVDFAITDEIDAYWYMKYFEDIMNINNIMIVAGAGNLETSNELDAVMYPAMSPSVIAVGGTNIYGDDKYLQAEFNSAPNYEYIQKPNIVAPAYMYGYDYDYSSGNLVISDNKLISGTSYSAPMVTGAIALLLEQNSDLKGTVSVPNTIGAIHALLAVSANQESFDSNTYFLNASGYDNILGAGLLDVKKLLEVGGASLLSANLNHVFIDEVENTFVMSQSIGFVTFYSDVTVSLWWNAKSNNGNLYNNLYPLDWSNYSLTSGNGYQIESADSSSNFELLRYSTNVGANITINVYQEDYFFQDNQGECYGDIIWLCWRVE